MSNTVTWLIQSNLLDTHQQLEVWDAVQLYKVKRKELVVIPHDDYWQDSLDITPEDGIIIPYVSNLAIKRLMSLGTIEGLCFDPDTFRADVWNRHRCDMLNQDGEFLTLAECSTLCPDDDPELRLFIRPIRDLKEFDGVVASLKDIREWNTSKIFKSFNPSETTEVLVNSLADIVSEYRCFIVGGRVIDVALYRHRGKRLQRNGDYRLNIQSPDLLSIFQEMAKEWLPHENCVMDVAAISHPTSEGVVREYKVIEFNCINCTGFYNHDIKAVIRALSEHYQFKKQVR